MKKWVHSESIMSAVEPVEAEPKLKRTLESGHSLSETLHFDNADDFIAWCREDDLYED